MTQNLTIPDKYSEIVLSQAIELAKLDIPENLTELISGEIQEKDLTIEDLNKHFPEYFRKVFTVLTTEDLEYFKAIHPAEINRVFFSNVLAFWSKVMFDNFENDVTGIVSFDFKDEQYFLPTYKSIFGNEIPMYNSTFGQWTDSLDLTNLLAKQLQGGIIEVLPNLISVLCLRFGESYEEEKMLDRAKIFEEIPYDIAREVFFCITRVFRGSETYMLTSLYQSKQENQKTQQNQTKQQKTPILRRMAGMLGLSKLQKKESLKNT